ncbi:acyl-CoA dehydrogenase [Pseudoduganella sp. DS3]|uniref:Acyl-CoA dehydrogenase n=1 Tax=Pseudoduganella guangdongensis TaxID=2692179 RepID=A0A6N9HIY0_9BURK|nr:acyl-CoA dehydrogenase family protein [Pseudoduganella guangdongensis]MYN03571.1 acyl-CoA dehydrogenase [Pseudoduganella guangdongensis]
MQDDTEALRASVRRFVEKALRPHVNEWEEAGSFPRALYRQAGELGLLALGFPEQDGGLPASYAQLRALNEELCRTGCGGLLASLFSHRIGAPPIVHGGSAALRARVLPAIYAGQAVSALAVTEPGGGSDVANLATSAVRDGDHYIVNGSKTFITSGMRADWITVAVRSGGPGAGGVSALLVAGDTPGLTRTPLRKMGWWCSDTAQLHFDQCRVPAANLLGAENAGFALLMRNFNDERLMLAMHACYLAQAALDEASEWALQRKTFGKALVQHQAVRHKLVAMATRIAATRAFIDSIVARLDGGGGADAELVAQVCMLKNFAAQTMQVCADHAVQILGGMGCMRGTVAERVYRDVKVYMIGGGAEEILNDLAARQLGWH